MFLGGQQEGQEVQGVGVITLELESLANVSQSFWYLV